MDPIALLLNWWQQPHRIPGLDLLVFSLLFLSSLLYLLKLTRPGKLNLPPSPPRLPIIGNLHQLGSLLHRSLHALSERYGPIVLLHVGNAPLLVVSSSEIAKEVLNGCDAVFLDRPRIRAAEVLFYGCSDIAFSPYGEYWRKVKKICVTEVLSQRRVDQFRFVREEEVAEMVGKIRHSSMNGAAIDVGEMFIAISNKIIGRSTLGPNYGGEGGVCLGQLSRRVMETVGAICFEDYFPCLRWIDVLTGFSSKLRTISEATDAVLNQIIEEHKKSAGDDQSDKKDFLDILLNLQRNGMLDINLTQENLKAIILDMFVGGVDTTATAMEWAMAELVKNPSVMKKAQEEVRRIVGERSKVDEADIHQMHYLKCVVKETLRLHPSFVSRGSSASAKLEGYDIPPGTKIVINAWAIQRDPKLWDRPEEFLPERFANSRIDFKGQHEQFITFGMGRRRCPGTSFAVIEVEYVLATLLYWFDWNLPDGGTPENLDMSDVYKVGIRKKVPLGLIPVLHSP